MPQPSASADRRDRPTTLPCAPRRPAGGVRGSARAGPRTAPPVIIHTRRQPTTRMPSSTTWAGSGVFHCLGDSVDGERAGYRVLSVHAGIVTGAKAAPETVKMVPSDRLPIETDSLYGARAAPRKTERAGRKGVVWKPFRGRRGAAADPRAGHRQFCRLFGPNHVTATA